MSVAAPPRFHPFNYPRCNVVQISLRTILDTLRQRLRLLSSSCNNIPLLRVHHDKIQRICACSVGDQRSQGQPSGQADRENALEPLDERNLFELLHPDFPGERLVACRNSGLAVHRARTRQSLLEAIPNGIGEAAEQRRPRTPHRGRQDRAEFGEVINRYRMKKHFRIEITDRQLDFARCQDKIAAEEALDGIYVIRTSLAGSDMAAEDLRSSKHWPG